MMPHEIYGPKWKRYAEILGPSNVLGLPENPSYLDNVQLSVIKSVHFDPDLISRCSDDYALVVAMSSIRGLRDTNRSLFFKQIWPDNLPFFNEGNVICQLVRKKPLPYSTDLTQEEQLRLIKQGRKVPTAQMIANMLVLYYCATGLWLSTNVAFRTSSVCPSHPMGTEECPADLYPVDIMHGLRNSGEQFLQGINTYYDGICINNFHPNGRLPNVGIAEAIDPLFS